MTARRTAAAVACVAAAVTLAAGVGAGWAQPGPGDAPAADNRLAFRHLTPEQGLPNASVNAVAQDAIGFLWIGTPDGLVRYDGDAMRPFRHSSDTTTVSGNVITALAPARGGALYVGTSVGLDRYDPALEAFARIGGLPSPDVVAVAADSAGGAWVATREGLAHVAPGARRARAFRHDPSSRTSIPSDEVWSVYADPAGPVWAGTSAGLARVDPASGRARTFAPDSLALAPVSAVAPRSAGGLYVGTQGTGLFVFRPESGRWRAVPLGGDVNARVVTSVHEDVTGTLWVGLLGGGLRRLPPGADAPDVFTNRLDDPASLADDNVSGLLEDRQGVLWVATYGGLDRTDLARGTAVRFRADPGDAASLPSNDVRAVLPLDGRLYVGTGGGLSVSRDDGRSFRTRAFGLAGSRASFPVSALLRDREGTVWVGTDGAGLYALTPDGPARAPVRSQVGGGLAELAVTSLLDDRSGRFWVGTRADGLLLYDRGSGRAVAYRPNAADPAALASAEVFALAQASDGSVWAGTAAGLCRVDRAGDRGAFTCLSQADGLPGPRVFSLAAHDGALWAGTDGGLARVAAGRVTDVYRAADTDLPGDAVYGIVEDETGFLWLSTSGGLVRFEPGTEVFTARLGEAGGLAAGAGTARGPDGRVYVGGAAGLLSFLPTRLRETNPNPPETVLTGVDVEGSAVEPGPESLLDAAAPVARTLRLDHDHDFVTFRFSGLHFSDPAETTFRYRLAGDHEDWREAGTRHDAVYTNLEPGRYTFESVATSADGVADPTPARLGVVVRPPWYRTLWATLAFLALGVVALWQADRWQRSRLLRRERERAEKREAELRAVTAEAEQRKAEAEAERQRAQAEARAAEATALQAENDRRAAELERVREVQEANGKLEAANERLETSLRELQAAQAQLVQSEKLASLGQLTAGIAHEIKNPLNFVNNFADLTVELVAELSEELRADPARPVGEVTAEVEDLLTDLSENARRIHEHGQRADRIVRAMLLHSRGGSSERARVDIARFVEEYANLAFHGARANDPDLGVTVEREMAPDSGEVEVVPQELGRVLINLITNAFHAVTARRHAPDAPAGYAPTVTVRTRREADRVVVEVADNGTGIPEAVRARIFEPFFTTKPSGEGTGLGLSLVHDIVVGVHGGEVTVESEEGAGTTFAIRLPSLDAAAA